MIGGHDVIIELCAVITKQNGDKPIKSNVTIETKGDFFVCGANINCANDATVVSKGNVSIIPSIFARAMSQIKSGAFHLKHHECSEDASAAAGGHDDVSAAGLDSAANVAVFG